MNSKGFALRGVLAHPPLSPISAQCHGHSWASPGQEGVEGFLGAGSAFQGCCLLHLSGCALPGRMNTPLHFSSQGFFLNPNPLLGPYHVPNPLLRFFLRSTATPLASQTPVASACILDTWRRCPSVVNVTFVYRLQLLGPLSHQGSSPFLLFPHGTTHCLPSEDIHLQVPRTSL